MMNKYPIGWKKDPILKHYIWHLKSCKGRNDKNGNPIDFKLTFEEWWDIWDKSGHWADRGKKKGQYVMSRINDVGHYEIGNVFIQTASGNIREYQTGRIRTDLLGIPRNNDVKSRISLSQIGIPKPKITCPHCGKEVGGNGNYKRWHGDNCKEKQNA